MNETKFNGLGQTYAQYRPSYPKEFMDYLYSDIGITKGCDIADVGSGTGILTRQLIDNGHRVYAVEPNADMRFVAETELGGFDKFVSVDGTAESTTLLDNSVDFITAAQAFHWFDRQRFRAECMRIIRPGGKVVLVWNCRDETSEMVRENDVIIRKYCPDFKGYSGGMRGAESDDDFKDFFSGGYDTKAFRNDLAFDKQGFIGRNLSSSYAPKEGDSYYQAYIADLGVLFEKFSNDGCMVMPNITRSYAGTV